MNIKNAKDHLARARGYITSAIDWLEQEEARPTFESIPTKELMDEIRRRSKKGYFQAETKQEKKATEVSTEWLREVMREEIKKYMKKWVQDHIYDIK